MFDNKSLVIASAGTSLVMGSALIFGPQAIFFWLLAIVVFCMLYFLTSEFL